MRLSRHAKSTEPTDILIRLITTTLPILTLLLLTLCLICHLRIGTQLRRRWRCDQRGRCRSRNKQRPVCHRVLDCLKARRTITAEGLHHERSNLGLLGTLGHLDLEHLQQALQPGLGDGVRARVEIVGAQCLESSLRLRSLTHLTRLSPLAPRARARARKGYG